MVSGKKVLKQCPSNNIASNVLKFLWIYWQDEQLVDTDIKDREGEKSSTDVYQGMKNI